MLISRLPQNRCPAVGGVALRAVFAHLAAVEVGVARGTILRSVLEHRIEMAGAAIYRNVCASKRIAGLGVVIKLRVLAQSLPTGHSVAVRARYRQRAMRISGMRRLT